MASCPIPIGEVFADKYRVDGVLGEGGMGIVMVAQHLELDQRVAVKFLLDDSSDQKEGAERFRREARAAAKIQSDHVVRVIDVGVLETGERYMVMEYLDGRDLAEELADRKSFPIGVAAGFILEAIDAVSHAHAVGIVHRDLKPANLFLTRLRDGRKRVKVLDFGISKSVGTATTPELSLTKTSSWIGSPLYMAPEQMESAKDVDERADVWSLGAILFELISGRTPYMADSLPHLCNLLLTHDPAPIKEVFPEIPDALATAIMGCLTRDPNARTQTALEFARALAPFATSITGSSMHSSLLMRADIEEGPQATAPHGLAAAAQDLDVTISEVDEGVSPGGTVRSRADGREESTHSAWGKTDPKGKKEASPLRMGLFAAALLGAVSVAFFIAPGAGGDDAGVESAEGPEMGAVQREAELPAELAAGSDIHLPEAGKAAPDADPPAEAVQPDLKPVLAPKPRPRPAKSRSKASATSESKAKVEPKAAEKDDFADFGGRR